MPPLSLHQTQRRRLGVFLSLLFLIAGKGYAQHDPTAFIGPDPSAPLTLRNNDHLLILAPHPDDDILCCAGILQEAVTRKISLRIVYLTYGDNYEWAFMAYRKHPVLEPRAFREMGLLRHDEAVAGQTVLGVSTAALTFLGYPDFGTMKIWTSHWGVEPPYQSMLTRVTAVPYANARRPGTPYRGEEIVRDLREILLEFRPTKIFLSHPGDQHPDHRALPLFVQVALWELKDTIPPPELFPYMVHAKGWPLPRVALPNQTLDPPSRLKNMAHWRRYPVPLKQLERKQEALARHRTQYEYDRAYLSSFVRSNELFGEFPAINLEPLSTASGPALAPATLEEEPASVAGLERKSIGLENGCLTLTARFSRPLGEETGITLYAYGDRADAPFGGMPKIRVEFGALRHRVFNGAKPIPWSSVKIRRQAYQVTAWIPLELLGRPEKILASARSTLVFPLDWATWHVLYVPKFFHEPLGPSPVLSPEASRGPSSDGKSSSSNESRRKP